MAKRKERDESRYVRVAKLAHALTEAVLPRYWHKKSPQTFTVPQLAACVLLMFYLNKSYRDMEEWLLATDQVRQALDLTAVPDHTTLYRTYRRLRLKHLDGLRRRLLDQAGVQESVIAVDTTGFRPTQASPHFDDRRGRPYRHFIKPGYAVGTESQFILAWRHGQGPGSDLPFLPGLRRDASRYGARTAAGQPAWVLVADKGFDRADRHPSELIPPHRKGHWLTRPRYWERAHLVDAARLDGVYGQRWKCETVNSVIKRKFGDTVRSRKPSHQRRETAVKGLVYNLHVCPPASSLQQSN
jgi:Transposase DDE domain